MIKLTSRNVFSEIRAGEKYIQIPGCWGLNKVWRDHWRRKMLIKNLITVYLVRCWNPLANNFRGRKRSRRVILYIQFELEGFHYCRILRISYLAFQVNSLNNCMSTHHFKSIITKLFHGCSFCGCNLDSERICEASSFLLSVDLCWEIHSTIP